MRVAVEGNIGSGKSAFLGYCASLPNYAVYPDPIEKWENVNGVNLLSKFYEDPSRWGVPFQLYAGMTTYENYQKETSKEVRILERSLLSSRHVFLEHMRHTGVIDPTMASVLDLWYDQMLKDFKAHPHVIVYLHSSPEGAYARMQSRARGAESTVTAEYLQCIHSLHETWLGRFRLAHAMEDFPSLPLHTIDADQPLEEMQKQSRYCLDFLDVLNST